MAVSTFACPACQHGLMVSGAYQSGKKIRCPNCQEVFVPAPKVDLEEQPSAAELRIAPGQQSVKDVPEPETLPLLATASFHEAPSSTPPETRTPVGAELATVPGHEILEVLGRGGMGIVYKARHLQLDRVVALKMILGGAHAGPDQLARFKTEAQAVARLQHPNIVQIFEVGEHQGLPYFSLEFCPGGSLASRLDGTPLPAQDAARIVATLAQAMHAAHQQHIIHRDLKPANILLSFSRDPTGSADGVIASPLPALPVGSRLNVAKITDFGLAKKLDDVGQTHTGAVMGTPSYMAPEQASGKGKEVGPAVDIYALGAILYQLLTGRPPFRGPTSLDTILQVLADDPVPPSRLNPKTPRDLETICLKCLHKEPRKRYGTATDLAEDLGRFQAGEPILARPVGNLERGMKWVKRRPVVAALLAAVVLVSVAGTGGITWALRMALDERDNAQAQEKTARDEKNTADRERKPANENAETALTNEKLAKENEKLAKDNWTRAEWKVYAGNIALAQAAWKENNASLAHHYLTICRQDRGWEHDYLWTSFHQNQNTLKGHKDFVFSVAFSPDGKKIVSGSWDKTLKVWDAISGQETLTLKGHTSGVLSVAFSLDGKNIVSGSYDKTLKVWDASSGQETLTLKGHTSTVNSVAFSPDGKKIVSGSLDATLKVWNASSGQETLTLKGHTSTVNSVAFSPDGKKIVSGSGEIDKQGELKMWDASSGRDSLTLKGHTGPITSVAFSPDGKKIVSGSGDKTLKVWDASSGQETLTLKGHTSTVNSVAFSPDGKKIVRGSHDKTLKVWDGSSGQEILTLRGHTSVVRSVAFSPDGKRIVSGSGELNQPGDPGEIKVWDVPSGHETLTLKGHTFWVTSVAFSPDGRKIVSGSVDNTLKVWVASSGQQP